MNLARFAVQRFQFTLVMFALLIAIGVFAYQKIPRGEDPTFPIPVITVAVVYPGADPQDMEALIADPIEDAIAELDDVKNIWTDVRAGVSVTRVEFSWEVSAEKKYDEAIRELNALRVKLPQDLAEFTIRKANPTNVNIAQFALLSDTADNLELRKAAENLVDLLEGVPGIKAAEFWGLPNSEIQVTLDPARMRAAKVSVQRVLDAVRAENTNIPGGAVAVQQRSFNLRTSGDYEDINEIANTIVAGDGSAIVRLKDIASVRWAEGERNQAARFNGKRAVFVSTNQKEAQNIFVVTDRVNAKFAEFKASLPKHITIERGFDQSRNVDRRLTSLGYDFAIAIGLVLITLLPLGLRAAGVVMISIPLSLACGVACMYFAGFSLNQLSIAGFVIALGLLVDDSIVVVENIERHLRDGKSGIQAAIDASGQIGLAVLGCTATLIFAFLPLMFLPEGSGKFVKNLPAAVVFTVIASLIISLTIIPFLSSRLLKPHHDPRGNRILQWLMGAIHRFYTPLLKRAMAWPKTTLLASFALFFATLGLVPAIGFSLFPQADTPQFLITVETPTGSSIDETDRALQFVEKTLAAHKEVKHHFATLGRGNTVVYYNIFPKQMQANYAECFVELHRYDPKQTPQLYDQLRQQFAGYAGAHIRVAPFVNGPPIDAPIAIRVTGPALSGLKKIAAQIEDTISKTEGTRDINNPLRLARTDLALNINKEKAGLVGVPTIEIDRTVRLAFAGIAASSYRDAEGDEFPITLRLPMQDGHPRLDLLGQIEVNSITGAAIPLKQFISPSFIEAPSEIQRYQRQRSVTLTAYSKTGFNTVAITGQILDQFASLKLPPGYRWSAAGEVESRKNSFDGVGVAVLIATFGILAVLILEFGSFKSTLVVAGVIPLGIVGGLMALFLSGYSLSFVAAIGFIALIGIEIKNSILLVDFTNQLRQQGVGLMDAIEQAGEQRFLPILLTSATAVGGLLPLALQNAALYSPMAWVIIGGLLSSTFLARLVTPVMYLLLPPAIEVVKLDR